MCVYYYNLYYIIMIGVVSSVAARSECDRANLKSQHLARRRIDIGPDARKSAVRNSKTTCVVSESSEVSAESDLLEFSGIIRAICWVMIGIRCF